MGNNKKRADKLTCKQSVMPEGRRGGPGVAVTTKTEWRTLALKGGGKFFLNLGLSQVKFVLLK